MLLYAAGDDFFGFAKKIDMLCKAVRFQPKYEANQRSRRKVIMENVRTCFLGHPVFIEKNPDC